MNQCPHCQRTDQQVKNGKTVAGSQVYKCKACNRKYVPDPKPLGHSLTTRQQAIQLILDGNSQRHAARHLGVIVKFGHWLTTLTVDAKRG